MDRKLIIHTAQGWYESAHDDSYTMSERLLFMENALNHTENALFASNQKLEQQEKQLLYLKANAEGEKIAREALQEENEKLISSLDRLVEQHESLSDENETLENNFKEFMYTADYNERQLKEKITGLESQVAVMRGALENIIPFAEDWGGDGSAIINVQECLSITPTEASQKIQELEKYAELGRLALNFDECFCPCKYGSEECGTYDCSESLLTFCKKRTELLAEGCN